MVSFMCGLFSFLFGLCIFKKKIQDEVSSTVLNALKALDRGSRNRNILLKTIQDRFTNHAPPQAEKEMMTVKHTPTHSFINQ